jgi:hypothetical protein
VVLITRDYLAHKDSPHFQERAADLPFIDEFHHRGAIEETWLKIQDSCVVSLHKPLVEVIGPSCFPNGLDHGRLHVVGEYSVGDQGDQRQCANREYAPFPPPLSWLAMLGGRAIVLYGLGQLQFSVESWRGFSLAFICLCSGLVLFGYGFKLFLEGTEAFYK